MHLQNINRSVRQGSTRKSWFDQQEAISQKEIVFRFRKDIQSEKGWSFDMLCVMRSPSVKGATLI